MRVLFFVILFFTPFFNHSFAANCHTNECIFYPEIKISKNNYAQGIKIKPQKEMIAFYNSSGTFSPLSVPVEVIAIDTNGNELENRQVDYSLALEHSDHNCRLVNATELINLNDLPGGMTLKIDDKPFLVASDTVENSARAFTGTTPGKHKLDIIFPEYIPQLNELQICSGKMIILAQKGTDEI